jgi:uncharacterized protein
MTKGNGDFAVKRTATGLGLFTLKPIRAGRRIVEYKGPLVTIAESNKIGGMYLFDLNERFSIDGRSRSNIARYLNHSCKPNAKAYCLTRQVWIYAERNLKAGEPITIHYGREYFELHIKPKGCQCDECLNFRDQSPSKSAKASA